MDRDRFSHISTPLLDGIGALATHLRRYFLTGLFLVVPMAVTIVVVFWLFDFTDSLLGDRVANLLGYRIPGVGLISTAILLVLAGIIAQNVIGGRLIKWIDRSLESLPVVRSLYVGVKQVSDVLFQKQQNEFQRVVMVEYPKEHCWALGFVTGDFPITIGPGLPQAEMVCVFVPTTPNPTSGFLLVLEKGRVIDTTLGIEEAMKMIISGGLVRPGLQDPANSSVFEDFTIPH